MIAGHPSHCVLMPWIATNYQWVLDHEICHEWPPVFDLLHRYANREETGCSTEILWQVFEIYPQGLTQVNDFGYTPLHAIVMGSAECNVNLFTWMAEQCPSNMLQTDRSGETPLHRACMILVHHPGDDTSEICKYLIAECPESARTAADNSQRLPIHILLSHCQHRLVKEVAVCLLREYPESYDMTASGCRVPSSVPFIQRIKPRLDEEKELKENVAYLQEMSGLFQDAVEGTENPSPLAGSICDAFSDWATVTFVNRLEVKMELVSLDLQNECNAD